MNIITFPQRYKTVTAARSSVSFQIKKSHIMKFINNWNGSIKKKDSAQVMII